MANEVTNETELETQNQNDSVSEETNNTNSDAAAADNNDTAATADSGAAQETGDFGGDQNQSDDTQSSKEEDFGSILEKFEQEQTVYHSGELVEGTVVGISERGVLIDFGHKSEGIVPLEEFTSPTGEVTVARGASVRATNRPRCRKTTP
jgi:hypothetical protein